MDTGILSTMNRMVDTGSNIDKGQTRNPLKNMFKKDKPQISLAEALTLLESKGILHDVIQLIKISSSHVRKLNKKGLYPQLNDDQKASITVYTMESQPSEDSVVILSFLHFHLIQFNISHFLGLSQSQHCVEST